MTDELLRWRAEFPALERSVYMVSHSLGAMPKRAYDYLRDVRRSLGQQGHQRLGRLAARGRPRRRAHRRASSARRSGSMVMATNVSQIQALVASCLDYTPRAQQGRLHGAQLPDGELRVARGAAARRRGRGRARRRRRARADGAAARGHRRAHADRAHLARALPHRRRSRTSPRSSRAPRGRRAWCCSTATSRPARVPVDVTALGVDFACGGSVKWLCGGPGAAYLYVRPDRIAQFAPRTTGWFGHEKPFAFTMPEQRYAPACGATWRARRRSPRSTRRAPAPRSSPRSASTRSARSRCVRPRSIMARCDAPAGSVNTPRAERAARRLGLLRLRRLRARRQGAQRHRLSLRLAPAVGHPHVAALLHHRRGSRALPGRGRATEGDSMSDKQATDCHQSARARASARLLARHAGAAGPHARHRRPDRLGRREQARLRRLRRRSSGARWPTCSPCCTRPAACRPI